MSYCLLLWLGQRLSANIWCSRSLVSRVTVLRDRQWWIFKRRGLVIKSQGLYSQKGLVHFLKAWVGPQQGTCPAPCACVQFPLTSLPCCDAARGPFPECSTLLFGTSSQQNREANKPLYFIPAPGILLWQHKMD